MRFRFIILPLLFMMVLPLVGAARTDALRIGGGRFFIKGTGGGEEPNNAVLQTATFTAAGFLGGQYSPWYDVCISDPLKCSFGKTVVFPRYSNVAVGGCIGSCYQFTGGTFVMDGVTYPNAFYRGYFNFSQSEFHIPKNLPRKGRASFRRPFTMTGYLQVCRQTNIDRECPADQVLFAGPIEGGGTVTATMSVKTTQALRPFPYPYLFQESFDYRFEP